jgi:DNA-directed RNA polymerase specialized sigma24 family protein
MQDDISWNFFKVRIMPHMRALRVTSLWLTKNRRDSQDLVGETLIRTFGLWYPSLSKAHCRVLLFKVLTGLFFGGFRKNRDNLSLNSKGTFIPDISRNRLTTLNQSTRSAAGRTIIRLPVEVRFVRFLSKMDRFSPKEIGQIISLQLNCGQLGSSFGSRLLQIKPFVYSGQG